MATTDFDWTQTKTEMIARALRICGALMPGDPMTSEMVAQGNEVFQDVIKSWQTDHVLLWTKKEQSVDILATRSSIDVTTTEEIPAIGIESARLVTADEDIPLRVITVEQYRGIARKFQPGRPEVVCYEVRWLNPGEIEQRLISVWPVPTEDTTLSYSSIVRARDWDSANDSTAGGMPVRFQKALVYAVAADLADEYGVPLSERQLLKAKADELLALAKMSDRERPTSDVVKGAF